MAIPEPSPTLKSLLDLPLRYSLDANTEGAIHALGARAREATQPAQWLAVYAQAIEIADGLVASTDRKLEELQRRSLSAEDPMEVRNRVSQAPRREGERAKSDAKAALQKAQREWLDRSRRQLEHVSATCLVLVRADTLLSETDGEHSVTAALSQSWWAEFSRYVQQCCLEWNKNFCAGSEQSLVTALREPLAAAQSKHGLLASPEVVAVATTDARLDLCVQAREIDVPDAKSLLLRSVSRMVMMIGGLSVAVIGGLSSASGQHGGSRQIVGLVVSLVSLLVFVFTTWMGYREAKRQQTVLRQRGLNGWRDTAVAALKAELERGLERHRKLLERWLAARVELWTNAIDRWWDARVEPALAQADSLASEQARDLKLQQMKLQEELSALRAFRNQLSQTILFDLRRRARELSDEIARR